MDMAEMGSGSRSGDLCPTLGKNGERMERGNLEYQRSNQQSPRTKCGGQEVVAYLRISFKSKWTPHP